MKSLFLILVSSLLLNAPKDIPTLKPEVGKTISFQAGDEAKWKDAMGIICSDTLDACDYSGELKPYVDKLEKMEGPMTEPLGCSWYCGGGPYKVLASSTLDNSEKFNADKLHDFDLFTGWSEGKSGYGVGEYVEFYFKPNSPRVNKLIFYNGYFKNIDLWKANSRIKKAKLYVNNVTYAILEFKDVNAPQTFTIEPLSSMEEGQDLVLKVEIMEVYKGTKYSDVVISEINFDGLDVH